MRVQITDAQGRSSQYSTAEEVVQGLNSGADDDHDGLPNGAERTINLLGIPLLCLDSDGDGKPDYQDPDDDNDGIPTSVECPNGAPCVDTDGDRKANNLDLDSDDDGITDAQECTEQPCRDTDDDGIPNYIDIDSDGDGLEDAVECPQGAPCLDADANGVEDYLEPPGTLSARGTGAGAMGAWMLLAFGGLAALRRRLTIVLAGLFGLMAMSTASASTAEEGWTSRFYGGAMVGGLFSDFDDSGLAKALQSKGYNVDRIDTKSDHLAYGAWLGYALSRHWGLELMYTGGADESVRFSGAVGADLKGALKASSPYLEGYGDSYLVRLRYHYQLSQNWFLSPHLGVGVTDTRQSFRSRDQKTTMHETSFTWAVGGGVHYALTENWSLGVGADYYRGSSDNGYGIVSGIVEWRFPKALPDQVHTVMPAAPLPVEVVPTDEPAPLPAMPVASQASAPAPVAAAEKIDLQGIGFEVNRADLTPASRSVLDGVANELQGKLQQSPQLRIEIGGHTDSSGNAARNLDLSRARAQTVLEYFVSHGIPRDRLEAVGYGSSQPLVSNDTAEGREQNRRVELKPL